MKTISAVVDQFNQALLSAGAVSPRAIKQGISSQQVTAMNALESVVVPDELRQYLSLVNGYDEETCVELDLFTPCYALGYEVMAVEEIIDKHENLRPFACGEDENFWPPGFIPFLNSNNSEFILINCRPSSPTRGHIYEYVDGEGTLYLSSSLSHFFTCCTQIVEKGLIKFSEPEEWEPVISETYYPDVAKIFGIEPNASSDSNSRKSTSWQFCAFASLNLAQKAL